MRSGVTTEIVEYILRRDSPPKEVKDKAVEHIMDGIAVMLAGSRTECARTVAEVIRWKEGKPTSTLLGFGFKAAPSDSALVNGTSGHADDYDDTQLSSYPDRVYGLLTHPTVPVLAASLAIGEEVDCTGFELLEAFTAGFEVECKLAEAISPEHYERGFHTTGTIGVFGACAASSHLLRLDEEDLRFALGIAASVSSGIRVNFGTMTKPLHAGLAASHGVLASLLGREGFTADREALDGRWGFMNVMGHGCDYQKIRGRLGNPYTLIHPGASIKTYPCGSLCQPSMDALLEIVLEEGITIKDVRQIRLRAGPNILEPLRYTRPVNSLQAKFSLNFGLACILVRHRAGLREYTNQFVNSPQIREAMGKVKTILDKELSEMGRERMRSIIEIELQDGRVIRRLADKARGTPEKPLKAHELNQKFRECASFKLHEEVISEVLGRIRGLETLSKIKELTLLLNP